MTLVERCYGHISMITQSSSGAITLGCSASTAEFADVVVDISTCVVLRDIALLTDSHQSRSLAVHVSVLAAKFLRCCVILAPSHLHNNPASHLYDPTSRG